MENEVKIGKSIMKARKERNLSRKKMADDLFLSEDTIKNWEQDRRVPSFASVCSLAEYFDISVSELIGDVDMNSSIENIILKNLPIINPEAAKTIVYRGYKEVIPAWNAYWEEYGNAIETAVHLRETLESEWVEKNSFLILFNKNDRSIVAIRDYGMYYPEVTDYLFKGDYVPIHTHQPMKEEELKSFINELAEKIDQEIEDMKSSSSNPLFLTMYCGMNNYLAWDIINNTELNVFSYKSYRKSFAISDVTSYNMSDIVTEHNYSIIPPSEELINMLGLNLDYKCWTQRQMWDKWEKREHKEELKIVPEQYKDIYKVVISLINTDRDAYGGMDEAFIRLEARVNRFERLCKLGAPGQIIQKEVNLLLKSINEISGEEYDGIN